MQRILLLITCLSAILFSGNIKADPDPGYYDSVDTASAQTLRNSLHEIIDDHLRIPYTGSSTDAWDVLEMADQSQDDPNRIITIYRNAV